MIHNDPLVKRIIRMALEEDLGSGDLTTDAIVPSEITGKAALIARQKLILAGIQIFQDVFLYINPSVTFRPFFNDGDHVPSGEEVVSVSGPISTILKGERTALNFLQRMCGIATMTSKYVERAGRNGPKVLDTRKTSPGLRRLEKYAVLMGGGANHRFGLFDGILIKDNHIAAAGTIARAVTLAKRSAPHTVRIEVEVETQEQAEEALAAGADAILLDNMGYKEMKQAVNLLKGKVLIEASGGITLDNIADVAATGVDFISVGALTHSANAVDLSLEIRQID